MPKKSAIFLCGILFLAAAAFGQNFRGTYTLTSGTTKLTLVLNQEGGGQVTGTLTSTTGAVFKLAGKVEEDVVMGTCQGQAGTSQFEASFDGAQLILTLIETGATGEVTSRSLEFARSAGATPPKAGRESPKPPASKPAAPAPVAPAQTPGGGNRVSDPEMGISFALPTGWNGQKQGEAIYLTSTKHKGFILIQRHSYNSLQEMAKEAGQGIVDEAGGTRLMPASQFQAFGTNGMAVEFSGVAQGQQSRSYAVGLISPQGGGVTVMAATEAASYTEEYPAFVRSIAGSVSFIAAQPPAGNQPSAGNQPAGSSDSSLMKYFAGEYYYYSSGSTIYGGAGTERKVTLCPDGLYRDSSEFSASGSDWGAANAQGGAARWSIQGNTTQGVIVVTYADGRSKRFNYRVVSKDGQTISFDGVTFAYAGAPKCR